MKRNTGKLTALFGTVVLLFSGCISVGMGRSDCSEKQVKKHFKLASFDKITQKTIADVVVRQGNAQKVSITASDDFMKYLKLEVVSGNLIISSNDTRNFTKECDVTVEVTVPSLVRIQSDGTGDFEFIGQFRQKSLTAIVNGTGDVELPGFSGESLDFRIDGTGDIEAAGKCGKITVTNNGTGDCELDFPGLANLNVTVNGTGDVEAVGTVNDATYTITGTGDIKARKMTAVNVAASCSGSGDLECYASESFKGSQNGSGTITCHGNPPVRNYNADGYKFPKK